MENFPITPELTEYIKEIASNLPKVQNGKKTREVILKGKEIIASLKKNKPDLKPPYKFQNGTLIKENRKYIFHEPVMIDHIQMLKSAWKKGGKPKVDEYVIWIKNNYNKQVTDKAKK